MKTVTHNSVALSFLSHVQRAADTEIGERMMALLDGRPVAEARHDEVAGGSSNFKGKGVLGVKAGASKMATEERKTDEQKRFEAAAAAAQIEPPTKPEKCLVSGDGLKMGMARQLAVFTIIARTESEGRRTTGGDHFQISVRGASTVKPRLVDHKNGEYTCEYRPSVSGLYYISVSLAGIQLPDSPFSVHVLTPCADAGKCILHGDGLQRVTARVPSTFLVDFKDALGNVTHAEELDVFVLARDEGPLTPEGTTQAELAEEARLLREEEERATAIAAAEAAEAEAQATAAALAAAAETARLRRKKQQEDKKNPQPWQKPVKPVPVSSAPSAEPVPPPAPPPAPALEQEEAIAPAVAAGAPAVSGRSRSNTLELASAPVPPLSSSASEAAAPTLGTPKSGRATPKSGRASPKSGRAAGAAAAAPAPAPAPHLEGQPATTEPSTSSASASVVAATPSAGRPTSAKQRGPSSARASPGAERALSAERGRELQRRLRDEFSLNFDRRFKVAQTSPTENGTARSNQLNDTLRTNGKGADAILVIDADEMGDVKLSGDLLGHKAGGGMRSFRAPRDLAIGSGRQLVTAQTERSLSPSSRRQSINSQEHRLGETLSAVMKLPASATPAEAAVVAMAASPLSPKVAHAQEAAASRKDASKKEGAKLDGAERQRHLRLWAKQLADEQSRIKAEAHAVQMLGARAQEGDAEAQAAIHAAAAGPSFASEIASEANVSPRSRPNGFAYGGIYPGTIHAHGKLWETHTVSFSIGRAGCYYLHVGLRSSGLPLPGSPFALKVLPGHAHALSTRLPTEALPLRTVVGETGSLVVHAADRVGNLCASGGDPLDAMEPTRTVECTTTDLGDGRYRINWSAKASGLYQLHVTVGGTQVYNSPVELTMLPANPDVGKCACTGTGLQRVLAGRLAVFRVKSRDRYSNPTQTPDRSVQDKGKMKFGLCAIPAAVILPAHLLTAEEAATAAPVNFKPKYTNDEIYGITKAAAAAAAKEHAEKLKELLAMETASKQLGKAASEPAPMAPATGESPADKDAGKPNLKKLLGAAALFAKKDVREESKEIPEVKKEEREKAIATSVIEKLKAKKGGKDGGKESKEEAEERKKAVQAAAEEVAKVAKAAAEAQASAKLQLVVTAKAATVPSMPFQGVWRPGGEYEIRYMWKEAGHFDLHVWCDVEGDGERQRLPGSPFRVTVSAAQPSASGSLIGNIEKLKYSAGERIEFTPQLRDQFGNPCAIVDRTSNSNLSGGSAAEVIMKEMLAQHGDRIGDRAMQAMLKVADGIKSFVKDPFGQASGWDDQLNESTPTRGLGSPELFTRRKVTGARDSSSSSLRRKASEDSVTPELTGWVVGPKGSTPLLLQRTDKLGQFEVRDQTITLQGSYEAHFALNGVPIAGSPVSFKVNAAAPSGKNSFIVAPDQPALVKLPYELTLHAVDRYGNKLSSGGARVEVKVIGASAPCTVVDHKDGTYSLHFTVNSTGSYQVEVRIDGLKVKGTPSSVVKDKEEAQAIPADTVKNLFKTSATKPRQLKREPSSATPTKDGAGMDSQTASPLKAKSKNRKPSAPTTNVADALLESEELGGVADDEGDGAMPMDDDLAHQAPGSRAASKPAGASKLGNRLG